MKRNSVFTKLLAMLLCVMMVIGCLPLSAFADQWEGDIDVVEDFEGSESNPMTPNWVWNEEQTEATASVAIPAGSTFYFQDRTVTSDTTLTANGAAVEVAYGSAMLRTPSTWTLTNETEESVVYALVLSVKEGTYMNPAELILGYNDTVLEGNGHIYYYKWTAEGTGTLSISIEGIDEGVEGDIVINNNTSYANRSLSADGFENEYDYRQVDMPVTEGDELVIEFTTLPDEDYNYPAATINHYSKFSYPLGSELNPIFLTGDDTVTNTGTIYYKGRFGGQTVTITGEGEFSVVYDGVTYNAVDGKIEIAVANTGFGPMAPVPTFALTGEGDFHIVAAYPVGTQDNPNTAVLGNNVADIAEGGSEYFWRYYAEKDGDLIVTISSADGNWQYTVDNMTTYVYGDTQWSDSDPVVNPATITVSEGDEIIIKVLTYNPDDEFNAPAGTITMNLAYAGPIVDENLVFMRTSLSFQDYVGIQSILLKTKVTGPAYEKVYVEAVQVAPEGTVTQIIEGADYGSVYMFDKQILAWSMSEVVTITLYAEKDGVTYQGQTFTTSVEQMAMDKIEEYYEANNMTACRALVDMLNYGATVQTAYNHNADVLPNTQLGDYAALGTSETPTFDATNSTSGTGTVSVFRNSVSMQSKVEIQMVFYNVDVSAYELRYTVDGETTAITSDKFSANGAFTFIPVAIKAANMRKAYTIALYDPATDAPVTEVYTVSVEAYAKGALGGDLNDVAIALLKYGDSVAAIA